MSTLLQPIALHRGWGKANSTSKNQFFYIFSLQCLDGKRIQITPS